MTLPVLGKVEGIYKSPATQKAAHAEFHVVRGTVSNLLGRITSEKLGLVSFPAADVYSIKATPAVIGKLIEEYSDRFQGMGKMPTQIKLHINQTVKPIHQKMRRVPLHVRAEVEKELDRLEQLDIIERASGSKPWVSPIVVVHKTQGCEST